MSECGPLRVTPGWGDLERVKSVGGLLALIYSTLKLKQQSILLGGSVSVRKITTSKVTIWGGYLDPRSRGSDEWGKC